MKDKQKILIFPWLLLLLTLWILVRSITAISAVAPVLTTSAPLPVIVIDPGHGGFDGGAVGIGGVVEKEINLAIAQELYHIFIAHGFEVVLTRAEDTSLEDTGLPTIRKRKNSDIHNRLKQAESYEDAILLSIHQNKFPQSSSFGAQIFYGKENPESKRIGELMQARLIRMVDPKNTRQAKLCGDSVYLIHHAKTPALLIECGFLSNPQEVTHLIDAQYQRKLAFAIFTSVCEALELETPRDVSP